VEDENPQQPPEGSAIERIYRYIQQNPGCHLRQIKMELGVAMGTVQYHLDRLEKAGKISSTKRGFYRYYFPVGIRDNEKDILQILSQETDREIIMFIIERGNPTQAEISNHTMISSPSVNWHIKRLTNIGLISEEKEGKFKRYSIRADPKMIVSMLRSYYPSIWDIWSNRLAEMFLALSRSWKEEP
jgi:predicted transcriptional regulator